MDLFYEIFAMPARAFRRIKDNPSWTVPIVGAIILILGIVVLTIFFKMSVYEYAMMETLHHEAAKLGIGVDQVVQELIGTQDPSTLFMFTLGEFTTDMTNAFTYSLLGILLPFVFFHFILVNETRLLSASLAVVIWSKFPLLVGALLKIPAGVLLKKPYMSFSLAMFLPADSRFSVGLATIDIFSIWTLVLLALGFSTIVENPRKKTLAWALVFGLWGAWFIVSLVKGLVFG